MRTAATVALRASVVPVVIAIAFLATVLFAFSKVGTRAAPNLRPDQQEAVAAAAAIRVGSFGADANRTVESSYLQDEGCRSNSTHIAWWVASDRPALKADTGISNNEIRNSNNTNCTFQTLDEAKRDAYQFLCQNVMEFDRPFMETMGFSDNYTFQGKVNGDSGGLIGPTIDLALRAKRNFASADALPQHIWQEYVLNYANLNEGRTNIRPILYDRLVVPLFLQERSSPVYNVDDMVDLVNDKLWTTLAPPSSCLWHATTQQDDCRIRYVSGQTPACIDPMSLLVYGSASGTGLAILLAHALRAAGIAARVAGTPAWHKDADNGNHNWVEYHVGKRTSSSDDDDENDWSFVEPSPMGDGRDKNNFYGHLNRGFGGGGRGGGPFDPWFCQARYLRNGTQFYAARLLTSPASTTNTSTTPFFPLAWERSNRHVPAQNRTAFYRQLCCKPLYDDDDGQHNKNDDSACYDYDEYRESSDVIGNS